MTVWAQSLRMRRIPPALHGRAFATLRTLTQATPPDQLAAAAIAMTVIAGLPGLYLVVAVTEKGAPTP